MRILSLTVPFQGERELTAALSLMTVIDVLQIGWFALPKIYESGARYRRENEKSCWHPTSGGCEDWRSAWEINQQGHGDCEDLSCWRAAELIVSGEKTARAISYKTPAGWHIVVRRADGSIEDPSARLGMNAGKKAK